MNIPPIAYGCILGIATGLLVGVVGADQITERQADQEKERAALRQTLRTEVEDNKNKFAFTWEVSDEYREHVENLSRLNGLTKNMARMPESALRDSFANAILEATKDEVVTDDEYEALNKQYTALRDFNRNEKTKHNAAKVRDGESLPEQNSDLDTLRLMKRLNTLEYSFRMDKIRRHQLRLDIEKATK